MKKTEELKILLGLTKDGPYPELFAELDAVPKRCRAERLRALALVGLIASRNSGMPAITVSTMAPLKQENGRVKTEGVINERVRASRDSLKKSLSF